MLRTERRQDVELAAARCLGAAVGQIDDLALPLAVDRCVRGVDKAAQTLGAALAAGVGAYWLLGMSEHGFWIPLTILFVLRPEEGETFNRLVLRAVGTAIGLVFATALAEWLGGDGVAIALALAIATAFAYGLLTVQYALFTAAITTYAVLLADSIGEAAR